MTRDYAAPPNHVPCAAPVQAWSRPVRKPTRSQSQTLGNQTVRAHFARVPVRPPEVTPAGDAKEQAARALSSEIMRRSDPVGEPAPFREQVAGGLDPGTRWFFESRFGTDLGHVRVHAGPAAAQSAARLGAAAYTLGAGIVMGAGQQAGPNLITAHELAHVVRGDAVRRVCLAPAGSDGFKIISQVWRVAGRDIVLVATGSGDQVLSFYRRTGLGYKGVGVAPGAEQWVPFKTLMEHPDPVHAGKPWFNKNPYYTTVGPDDPLRGYANTRNKEVGAWLDGQQIQPGVEAESWETVEREMDQVARSYRGSSPGGGAPGGETPGGSNPEAGSHEAQATEPPKSALEAHEGAIAEPTPVLEPKAGFRAGFRMGLKEVFSAENIAAMIPDVILAVADKVAAREAVKRISIKFAKEGFAKGVAACVMEWSEEEVNSNLKNHVTSFRVEGLEDPAGFLTRSYILRLAEAYENYAVDIGYQFSSAKTLEWKKNIRNKGLGILSREQYHFGDDPRVLFEYNFIDKLAWVLRSTTDPIIETALK